MPNLSHGQNSPQSVQIDEEKATRIFVRAFLEYLEEKEVLEGDRDYRLNQKGKFLFQQLYEEGWIPDLEGVYVREVLSCYVDDDVVEDFRVLLYGFVNKCYHGGEFL